eukprot:scaffold125623_cov63-Phaeocystis_antarctica.AAC.1
MARPLPGSGELPRATGRALRRRRSRAGALPTGHVDHAAALALGRGTEEEGELQVLRRVGADLVK